MSSFVSISGKAFRRLARKLAPHSVTTGYRRFRRQWVRRRNQSMSVEQVFSQIYEKNLWGGRPGEFCSGSGTSNEEAVSAYISTIAEKASSEGFLGAKFVDLGCGDFRVGRQLLPFCSDYTGCDVVRPLIRNNEEKYGGETVRFLHLDIVNDDLPAGDVCFVRQVFQHLSNQQISSVIPKLRSYGWVFITEHHPPDGSAVTPNRDKTHGGDIRLYENSGVYLSEAPLSLPERAIEKVLEIPWLGEDGSDAGFLRTFLFRPKLLETGS